MQVATSETKSATLCSTILVCVWFVVLSCQYSSHSFPHSGSRSSKTFKPKKNIPEGTHQYDLMKHAAATLGSGNLRNAVALPDGEDLNEWVAVNSKLLKSHCISRSLSTNISNSFTSPQLLTSLIKLICCMALLRNSVQRRAVA